jgi:hypothetical protein
MAGSISSASAPEDAQLKVRQLMVFVGQNMINMGRMPS